MKKKLETDYKLRICKQCGKEFRVPDYYGKGLFCSRKCSANYNKGKPNVVCAVCGKKFHVKPKVIRQSKTGKITCSYECAGKFRSMYFTGSKNGNYREYTLSYYTNGQNKNKYCFIKIHGHPFERTCKGEKGLYPYHKYMVEQYYFMFNEKYFIELDGKFYLKPKGVCVHHINMNTLDNRIENLIPVTNGEHTKIHNLLRSNKTEEVVEYIKKSGVFKEGELLEKHINSANQQPSQPLTKLEGSTTNGIIW